LTRRGVRVGGCRARGRRPPGRQPTGSQCGDVGFAGASAVRVRATRLRLLAASTLPVRLRLPVALRRPQPPAAGGPGHSGSAAMIHRDCQCHGELTGRAACTCRSDRNCTASTFFTVSDPDGDHHDPLPFRPPRCPARPGLRAGRS
jgi:hypothetical protein